MTKRPASGRLRLLSVVQRVDEDHAGQGFLVKWLEGLSKRTDLEVVAPLVGRHSLDIPVHNLGKAEGVSRATLGMRYLSLLRRIFRRRRPDLLFGHKCARYGLMALPLAKPLGVRTAVWHGHYHLSLTLRAAIHLCDGVLTTVEREFPLWKENCHAMGHGIDTDLFRPRPLVSPRPERFRVIFLSRFSPVKDPATLVRAAAVLKDRGFPADFILAGHTNNDFEKNHLEEIKTLAGELGLIDYPHFEIRGAVPHPEAPDFIAGGDVFVNLIEGKGKGKVVLEAMAAGIPTIVCSRSYAEEIGGHDEILRFRPSDPEDLAAKIEGLARMPEEKRREIGLDMRREVVARHGIEVFLDRLTALFEEIAR